MPFSNRLLQNSLRVLTKSFPATRCSDDVAIAGKPSRNYGIGRCPLVPQKIRPNPRNQPSIIAGPSGGKSLIDSFKRPVCGLVMLLNDLVYIRGVPVPAISATALRIGVSPVGINESLKLHNIDVRVGRIVWSVKRSIKLPVIHGSAASWRIERLRVVPSRNGRKKQRNYHAEGHDTQALPVYDLSDQILLRRGAMRFILSNTGWLGSRLSLYKPPDNVPNFLRRRSSATWFVLRLTMIPSSSRTNSPDGSF